QAEDGIRDLIVTGVQTCALPIYGRVLLKQRQQEGPFRRKMPVDGPFGEACGEGDLVERRQFEAALGEQFQTGRNQQGPRFRLASLVNDSHGYLGYSSAPIAQDLATYNSATATPTEPNHAGQSPIRPRRANSW